MRAFMILVNLCLLMQGTSKPLPSKVRKDIANLSMLDWNCQIFNETREWQKELFIKSSDTIQSTRRVNRFLVGEKILDDGWRPWSNLLALLPSTACWRFLMLRVNFRRIDFVNRKNIVIFQSTCKNTYNPIKKGMRTWRMQSPFHNRSCVKRVDRNSLPKDYNLLKSVKIIVETSQPIFSYIC